jgi:hypothetical protein
MIQALVELEPNPRYFSVWCRFRSKQDFDRVRDRCEAGDWQVGGEIEQAGQVYGVDVLLAFGGGGCDAVLDAGDGKPVAGLALLRIES